MKKNLLDNPKFMFGLRIFGIVLSVVIIIFCGLQLFGIMDYADNIFMPGLGLLMFIQGIENLKKYKELAYLSFAVSIFIYVVAFFKFF